MMLRFHAAVNCDGGEILPTQGSSSQVKQVRVILHVCVVVGGSSSEILSMQGSE